MSWIDDVLADFGRSLGIDGLAFNEGGLACLDFEILGQLFIERVDDGVLVYVMRTIDHPTAEHYATALDLCHWRHNHPFAVNAALRDDSRLVFAVNLLEREFSLQVMEQLIQFFGQLHEAVSEGVTS